MSKPAVDTTSTITETASHTESGQKKTHHMKDSGSRIRAIARAHSLDALIAEETPSKTLFERAMIREKQSKEQRQKNLEQIVKAALGSCKNEVAGEPDFDWLVRYFDMAKEIHNSSMQKLWAQVLKREVTNPGSTSLKALKTLRDMTPKEAQTLQRAASLACSFGTDTSRKLLLGIRHQSGLFSFSKRESLDELSLGEFQLPYSSLLLLVELGILLASELVSGEIAKEPALKLSYQGKEMTLQPKYKGITLTYYRFTPAGNELCQLLGNRPNHQYQEKLLELLNRKFTVKGDIASSFHHTV
ncbi:TIGR03899 family protein [Vibrio hangzhouensis]|uniref:TIGR03899 family protein n=1 Tax=Vibrio hangzhouensis TaxID=462991 RepID=UPI001C93BEAD|nr:TIGR03899 family protein [Vibrio hangzhouensis]MBY6196908.1 TIGR03899 family protein [Vibrio hangzhouensis]